MISEAHKEYNRIYYRKHRERLLSEEKSRRQLPGYAQKSRAYYKTHRLSKLAQKKIHYSANRHRKRAYNKKWYSENQQTVINYRIRTRPLNAAREARRRARKRGRVADVSLANKFYTYIRSREWIKCYYCGDSVSGAAAHIDHVIALARGGNHVSENLAASCPDCNRSKLNKLPQEWDRHAQMFLNL